MKILRTLLLLSLVCLLLMSCGTKADFDIRGEWLYTMTAMDGNTYDTGMIKFSGEATRGTYLEINIYEVEYDGEYTVDGVTLKLGGHENWEGTIEDLNTISGSWSHEDGVSGTFVAARK